MKKILSLLLACILILTSVSAFAWNENYMLEELMGLNIFPASFGSGDGTEILTREELTYIAAHLVLGKDCEPADTRFNDVKANNIYSGYIALLDSMDIMHGVDEKNFNPQDKVTTNMFFKVLFELIGYGDFARMGGGYPDGYLSLARKIDSLKKYAVKDAFVTKETAVELVYDAINTKFGGVTYYYENGELASKTDSSNRFSILGHYLGISVYTGYVDDIDEEKGIVTVSSVYNEYDTNADFIPQGTTVYFKAKNMKKYSFKNAPVVIYADSDKKIVHMALKNNTEIIYGYIASVNNNTRENALYSINNVKTLTLLNDKHEYKLHSNADMYWNNRETLSSVRMTGNFARLVLTDGKISSIDAWDLKTGGLLNDISTTEIKYLSGASTRRINKLDTRKEKIVFVDGEVSDISSFTANTVFDFYLEDDLAVFVVSTKKITDLFYSVTTDSLEIGNSYYIADDVYYTYNGTDYKLNDYTTAIGADITAHFGPDSKVRYVSVGKDASVTRDIFTLVCGGDMNNTFGTTGEFEVIELNQQLEKKTYAFNHKTILEDELTYAEIAGNMTDTDCSNDVYVMTVSNTGSIRKISRPLPYDGYELNDAGKVSATNVTEFIEYSIAQVKVGTKYIFFTDSVLAVGVYDANGETKVIPLKYATDLKARNGLNLKLDFYRKDEPHDEPDLIVITGTLDRLGSKAKYGIVDNKRSAVMKDSDTVGVRVDILSAGGVSQPVVTEEYAGTINDYSLIYYTPDCKFGENGIYLRNTIADLSKHHTEWDYVESDKASQGIAKGFVKKIEERMIWLDDGNVFPITSPLYVSVDESSDEERFKIITWQDIYPGDEIFYRTDSYGAINIIICVE